MSRAEEIPVLVGVGQILQRLEDPLDAAEPLELMRAALVQAGEDSGAPSLLQRADSIYVVRGMWGYGDPARALAARLAATPSETVGPHARRRPGATGGQRSGSRSATPRG